MSGEGAENTATLSFEEYLFQILTDLRALNTAVEALAAATDAYAPTNVTTDRAFDADTVAVAELADVVGTLIADLQAKGIISS